MMNIKSNIIPSSNIYTANEENVAYDRQLLSRIHGKRNLEILKNSFPLRGDIFTALQQDEWNLCLPCTLQQDRDDQVWGVTVKNGKAVVECRCYEIDCRYFQECRPGVDPDSVKQNLIVHPTDWKPFLAVNYIPVITRPKPAQVKNRVQRVQKETRILDFPDEPKIPDLKDIAVKFPSEEQLTHVESPGNSQESIIKGKPGDHMLVLAGPGTGKTYCLLEKLKYLVEVDRTVEADEILLLCFTRAAVKEIRERFLEDLKAGEYSDDLSRLDIRTFDSFATRVLNYLDADTTWLDYDQRIEQAIKEIEKNPGIITHMKHFIVDEIQDLVGIRARFVQTIIKNKPEGCGITLLGDHLQGIYDYQVKDKPGELSAVALLGWVKNHLSTKINVIRLTGNRRQNDILAAYSHQARRLLESDEGNASRFLETINHLPSCGRELNFDQPENAGKMAVLCRNNGQVLKLSANLRKRGIDHIVRRKEITPLLPVWVADLLLEPSGVISEELLENANEKNRYWPEEITNHIYRALEVLTCSEDRSCVRTEDLRTALATGNRLPDELYVTKNTTVFLSTIHQSKGREFDTVLILKTNFQHDDQEPFEEAKICYVAITRAKKDLFTIEPSSAKTFLASKYSQSGRWTELLNFKKRLVSLEIGMADDVDEQSFVDSKLIVNPEENQFYIRNNIKPGDPVEIIMDAKGNDYVICHNENPVGKMSCRFVNELENGMKEVCWRLPAYFGDVYIDKIYTVVKKPETIRSSVPAPWSEHGVWNAVSVTGMGVVHWDFE